MRMKIIMGSLAVLAGFAFGAAVFELTLAGIFTMLALPFVWLGGLLRSLSLASPLGNGAAIALYTALGLCPLFYLLARLKKKTARAEDSLLAVLSGLLFYVLYCQINPALASRLLNSGGLGSSAFGSSALGIILYSALSGYLVLRFLRRISRGEAAAMLGWLQVLLAAVGAMFIFAVFYQGVGEVAAALGLAGSDALRTRAPAPAAVLVGFGLLRQLPALLSIWLLVLALKLTAALQADRFGEQTVAAAIRLATGGKLTAAVAALTPIALNLGQLALGDRLLSLNFSVTAPIGPLALALVLLVLARYLAESSRLKQENQLFV